MPDMKRSAILRGEVQKPNASMKRVIDANQPSRIMKGIMRGASAQKKLKK